MPSFLSSFILDSIGLMMFSHSFCIAQILLAGLGAVRAQAVVRGVNLGGWLVAEEWYGLVAQSMSWKAAHTARRMTPSLFNVSGKSQPDEWSLCAALGRDKCLDTLQNHWSYVERRCFAMTAQQQADLGPQYLHHSRRPRSDSKSWPKVCLI